MNKKITSWTIAILILLLAVFAFYKELYMEVVLIVQSTFIAIVSAKHRKKAPLIDTLVWIVATFSVAPALIILVGLFGGIKVAKAETLVFILLANTVLMVVASRVWQKE